MTILTGILDPADYDAVRMAIDQRVSELNLPNSKVGLPIFQNKTDRWVTKQLQGVPINPVEPTQEALIKEAATYYCASLMVMKVVDATQVRVQTRDSSYSKNAWNLDDKTEELKQAADTAIQDLISFVNTGEFIDDERSLIYTTFITSPGTRAQI